MCPEARAEVLSLQHHEALREMLFHGCELSLQQQSSLGKCLLALLCTSVTQSNQSLEDNTGITGCYKEAYVQSPHTHKHTHRGQGDLRKLLAVELSPS